MFYDSSSNQIFLETYSETRELSVDESMIKLKRS